MVLLLLEWFRKLLFQHLAEYPDQAFAVGQGQIQPQTAL
jgi:hypothetical protein